ncbi:adenosine deaminase-like protein isoform X2 [Ceratitis capitata]|uniref:(Mediterranean fruit fly) hypothetical protein n=2 Tax=Ceratitis capitata TaxID=7213 RepID=W8BQY3_CERCA|nr:adenosine deaminase-like protein isoform X2 [Ceratitis capitata]XP_004518186.1 adenosine deaminase-like protein isoform X2 [Ceratitis capitata]CAD6996174.1 unnamed protein product [Ceratitis capitata]
MNINIFVHEMPKVELHAHLNGSLSVNTIQELGAKLYGSKSEEFTHLSEQLTNFDNVDLGGCFEKFDFMHKLTSTRRGLHLATILAIRDFAKDNVAYLELRTTPKNTEEMSKKDYLECVLEGIVRGKELHNILVTLLISIDRSQSVAEAEETINIIPKFRSRYNNIIAGIDFSGNPNKGNFSDFKPVLEKAREDNLKLSVHCAEIHNPSEVDEMIEFGMDRCGHGTFLTDQQLHKLGKQKVAIECCLTSNVKCSTVAKYSEHHFRNIFTSESAPVVLCTDDCGIFNTTLSNEFLMAKKYFALSKPDMMKLSLTAVDHAFVSENVKRDLRRIIERYFDSECLRLPC